MLLRVTNHPFASDGASFDTENPHPGKSLGTVCPPTASRPFWCTELGNLFLKQCAQSDTSNLNYRGFFLNFLDLIVVPHFLLKFYTLLLVSPYNMYSFKTTATVLPLIIHHCEKLKISLPFFFILRPSPTTDIVGVLCSKALRE